MLKVTKEDDFTIVTPTVKDLDSHVAADFKAAFGEVLQENKKFILLDLEEVTFMDSSGLAAVVFCFQMTDIKNKLAICGVGERVMKLFELTQMHSVVQIYKTKEEAIQGMTKSE